MKAKWNVLVAGMAAMALQTGQAAQKPNIVMIVADDMGYADCGAYGCEDIPTPHIDALAKGGVRFTDGYVTGTVCSPTRAALMTGRYHHRDGVDDWIPQGKPGLNANVPTVAEYLRKAGYRTALIGKWHLGEAAEYHPLRRGFDEFYGFLGGQRSYFPDKPLKPGEAASTYTQMLRGESRTEESEYTTHAFAREAEAFIGRQKSKGEPFFLYLAFNAVHIPLQAPEDYLKRFVHIPGTEKPRRTYAAMLAAMDDAVGRVSAAIHDAGLDENTLVCFISDNGGPITRNAPNGSRNTPLRGGKGETWEGGIRVPFIMKWTGALAAGGVYRKPVIQMDLTATFLALAGMTPDAQWPVDGVDLMPFLKGGNDRAPHDTLCWKYGAQWAIRQGDWKLVAAAPSGPEGGKMTVALYNLAQDISEANDLSGTEPERVNRLQPAWSAWRKDVLGKREVAKVDRVNVINAP